jgi:hypothetical protein
VVTDEQETVVKHSGATSMSVRSTADVADDHDGDRAGASKWRCLGGS